MITTLAFTLLLHKALNGALPEPEFGVSRQPDPTETKLYLRKFEGTKKAKEAKKSIPTKTIWYGWQIAVTDLSTFGTSVLLYQVACDL